ncbi:MAG: restriction endonuclease [Verrucomicrobiales bacterium]|nr:restriction endonuclease [Verrucomicrobiales bacterium]|tara:strand:+ start:588 stop:1433 length:846 start_codon:yes stop_codon:yes gene_type:complete
MSTFEHTFDDLFNPCLEAFRELGGSATNAEIEENVIQILNLSNEEVSDIHRDTTTKLHYRLRWARNYLKRYGLLENSSRGVWALTEKGRKIEKVDQKEVVRTITALDSKSRKNGRALEGDKTIEDEDDAEWQDKLLTVVKKIDPEAFERLSQRLLRELGFNNVEVTGKTGDGGIDGSGILKIGSIITFRVVFQCKRYKESVSSSVVRDFRGAVQGRADKDLLISTGSFTRSARAEAQRDGALAIDLMDGYELAQKLKELGLGTSVEMVENVSINEEWFKNI